MTQNKIMLDITTSMLLSLFNLDLQQPPTSCSSTHAAAQLTQNRYQVAWESQNIETSPCLTHAPK